MENINHCVSVNFSMAYGTLIKSFLAKPLGVGEKLKFKFDDI